MKTGFLAPIALALVVTGCQSELAQQPYGPKEQRWGKVIKENYPDWNPPPTVPPDRVPSSEGPAMIVSDSPEVVEVPLESIPKEEPPTPPTAEDATAATPPLNDATEYQTYTVEKGDNLWKISKRFYGSGKLWKRIYEANSDIIANPDKIKTGMQLKIPAAQ